MGYIVASHDPVLGRRVAVQRLLPNFQGDERAALKFVEEARRHGAARAPECRPRLRPRGERSRPVHHHAADPGQEPDSVAGRCRAPRDQRGGHGASAALRANRSCACAMRYPSRTRAAYCKIRCRLTHPAAHARWTNSATLARERHQVLLRARFAFEAREAATEQATVQIAFELPPHERR